VKKIIMLFACSFSTCFSNQWYYEHKDLSELKEINAKVFYDDRFAVYIKYKNHWYEVVNSDHHELCPCFLKERYHKDLCQELSGY
jgi:hypothetical protein